MRKVKDEYEKCTENYNMIMRRNFEKKQRELLTTTATPIVGSIRLSKRQHKIHPIDASNSSSHHQNSSSNKDHGNEQIKTVCW
jgi:hypothetical protein